MDFGQRLLQLLYHHGISQKQLALELKIAPTTLNGYVNNRREPDYKILKEISNFFNVSTDYLLGNQPSVTIEPPALSKHEVWLLHYYRQLNPDQKDAVDDLLKVMQKQKNTK